MRTCCDGIGTDQLPAVMKDAIQVCRVLGIPFLWIDALCILQDSLSDWEEQSWEMAKIFGGSWLTICAASSFSCQEGFLNERRPPALSFEYTSPLDPLIHGTLNFRPTPTEFDTMLPSPARYTFLAQDLKASRWNTRGWVFQEQLLSPRKLYFGHSMLHFQDGNHTTSENGFTTKATLDMNLATSSNSWTIWPVLKKRKHMYALWLDIVYQLHRLQWTHERDLFPALSGIAAAFSKATNDRYMAGHWLGDLACNLLWHTYDKPDTIHDVLERLSRGNVQSAPSWSWASQLEHHECAMTVINNMRCRIRSHVRQEFEVLEARLLLDGSNPFGTIKQASLRLSGKVIPFPETSDLARTQFIQTEWYKTDQDQWIYIEPDWTLCGPFVPASEPDSGLSVPFEETKQLKLLLVSSCCCERRGLTRRSGDVENERVNVIYKTQYRKTFFHDTSLGASAPKFCPYCRNPRRRRDIWGLLLYPAAERGYGKFYRVGIFLCRAEHGGSDLFRDVEKSEIELV